MVRVDGDDPSSHPWEGYIIAVIRYPHGLVLLYHKAIRYAIMKAWRILGNF
jgi:hypothetical protein